MGMDWPNMGKSIACASFHFGSDLDFSVSISDRPFFWGQQAFSKLSGACLSGWFLGSSSSGLSVSTWRLGDYSAKAEKWSPLASYRVYSLCSQKNPTILYIKYVTVGSKNSVFSFLPICDDFVSVAFCLIWSLFATFLGYIARYAPSKTDKNPIKSIQKSIRHNL